MKYFLILFLLFTNFAQARDFVVPKKVQKILDHHQNHPELARLLVELLENNPKLQAKRSFVQSYHHEKITKAWIDDPKLGVNLSNIPTDNPSFSKTPMSGKEISLEQNIPFPTKLITQNKIGEANYQKEKADYFELVHQIIHEFKQDYFELSYLYDALEINQQNLNRLNSLGDLLKSKYTTDSLALHDLLEVEIQADQIHLSIIQIERLIKTYQLKLNSLLNRNINQKIKIDRNKKLAPYPNDLEKLIHLAIKNRSLIQKYDYKIDQTKKENSLAKQGFLPDFKIRGAYRIREDIPNDPVGGENFISGGISINLPFLWTAPKHLHQIQKTKSLVYAAKKEKENLMNEIIFEITTDFQKLNQLQSQINLIENQIISKSKASVESSKTSFEADNLNFQELIRLQNSNYLYELSLARYQFDYQKTRSNLERLVGDFF
jgi:outer membrane protein TolC